MPKLAPSMKPDTTTATGQAVARAATISKRRGSVATRQPVDAAGLAEATADKAFSGALTQTELDGLDAPGTDTAEAPPAAKKTVAKRTAKKAPAKVAGKTVVAATDAWFAPLDETDDKVNCLWYGKQGSTKTTSAATAANEAPAGSKVLFINAEGGLKIKALRKRGVDTSKIVVFPNPASDDKIDDESMERVYLRVQADLMENPDSWFAVVIDSVTDVGQTLVDSAQLARTNRQIALNPGAAIDANFVDRDDYGVSAKIIRKYLRRFRDLPCHFLVTALMRRDVDEDTNKVAYGPAVSPAVANDLMGYVDLVILTRDAEDGLPVRGLTKNGGKYAAKDRFDMLPKIMVEPTFDRVLAYMRDEITPETDAMQESLPVKPTKAADKVGEVPEEDTETSD